MYDNQVIKSWDSVKIVDSAEDYVGFVTNNQMKFVIGDILITNQRDSIYIKWKDWYLLVYCYSIPSCLLDS